MIPPPTVLLTILLALLSIIPSSDAKGRHSAQAERIRKLYPELETLSDAERRAMQRTFRERKRNRMLELHPELATLTNEELSAIRREYRQRKREKKQERIRHLQEQFPYVDIVAIQQQRRLERRRLHARQCPVLSPTMTLRTLFGSDIGYQGFSFDVTNLSSVPITITGWSFNISTGVTVTGRLFWRLGTASGFERILAGWTKLGNDATAMSAGLDNPTAFDFGQDFTIMPGQTIGFSGF
mmetsp:Transcript_16027/g.26023  ORF Transcript_16027/g.26023 Transcript_16027/m.26023 type:complete len:240 (+) Transcript_16027:103-822(+)